MGIVYEAEQKNPQRRVALKVVRGGQFVDDVYLRMFRRETETLARLAHPNIAAIYEAGRTDDGQHFFTMELVTGQSLGAHVRDKLEGKGPRSSKFARGWNSSTRSARPSTTRTSAASSTAT